MLFEEYQDINTRMSQSWSKCQYALDMAGIRRTIDEMSVLLTPEELRSYRELAAEHSEGGMTEMKWFNGVVSDTMTMEGIGLEDGPSFEVRFEFFRPRLAGRDSDASWRVEAMAVLEGYAPLHDQPIGRVVHASYKLGSPLEYEAERALLERWGMKPVAHYRNSYGKFSYWENGDFPWGAPECPILLKPRVNLRGN